MQELLAGRPLLARFWDEHFMNRSLYRCMMELASGAWTDKSDFEFMTCNVSREYYRPVVLKSRYLEEADGERFYKSRYKVVGAHPTPPIPLLHALITW
jgi:hypothetical protein